MYYIDPAAIIARNSMRIAMFHELHTGGARRSVNEFAIRLKKNHTVDLYIIDQERNAKEKQFFSAVYFYQFAPRHWKGHDWKTKVYKDSIELLQLRRLHAKIALDIDQKQYDIVFVEPSRFTQAPFLLRFLKTKSVYYCQEPLRMVYEPFLDKTDDLDFIRKVYERTNRTIRKMIDKRNIKMADNVLANSHFTALNIKRAYGIKSTVLYMGVDPTMFYPEKEICDIDVLFIGAYEYVDGYSLLEEAKQYLKKEWNIRVLASEKEWITDDATLRKLYSRAKVAVSLAFNEPFGLIPLEAMACGTPMIAVDEGGYSETILHNKTGILIKRDPKALASAIALLLTNPKKLESFAKAAREEIIKDWTWDLSTIHLESILQKSKKKRL